MCAAKYGGYRGNFGGRKLASPPTIDFSTKFWARHTLYLPTCYSLHSIPWKFSPRNAHLLSIHEKFFPSKSFYCTASHITKLNKIATWEAAVLQQLCNSQALLHACTYTIIVCWNTSLFERWVSIGRDFPGVHGADANLIQGAMENVLWKWGGSGLKDKSWIVWLSIHGNMAKL